MLKEEEETLGAHTSSSSSACLKLTDELPGVEGMRKIFAAINELKFRPVSKTGSRFKAKPMIPK